jgi:hypothetical protein
MYNIMAGLMNIGENYSRSSLHQNMSSEISYLTDRGGLVRIAFYATL